MLMVLVIPCILGLVGLAIDLARAIGAARASKNIARLAALSATEHYYELSFGVGAIDRLNSVKTRVNWLIDKNILSSSSASHSLTLGFKNDPPAQKLGGVILPGVYYFTNPVDPVTGVASAPPCGTAPCFQEVLPANFATAQVNAFKVQTNNMYGGVTVRFMRALGINSPIPINSEASATARPRNIVFAVDNSGSLVSKTHIVRHTLDQMPSGGSTPWADPKLGRGSRFAFFLPADNPGSPNTNTAATCDQSELYPQNYTLQNWININRSDFCQWRFLDEYDVPLRHYPCPQCPLYDGLFRFEGLALGYPDTSVIHYRDDYQAGVIPYNDAQYAGYPNKAYHPDPFVAIDVNVGGGVDNKTLYRNNPGFQESYRVDKIKAPEPLTTVFRGLKTAVDEFENRAVTGDHAGLVFFDSSLTWSRVIELNSNWAYMDSVSTFNPVPSPNNLSYNLGLFPRYKRHTDLLLALEEGFRQIMAVRQSQGPSADSIVYIGDFLPNCHRTSALDPATADCFDDYYHYRDTISDLRTFVQSYLVPNDISFSVILIGDHVSPHTLDIVDPAQGGGGKCLGESEARAQHLNYVMGGDPSGISYANDNVWNSVYLNMSPSTPFYQANADAYSIVRASGGVFAPLLKECNGPPAVPPCPIDDPSCCNNGLRRDVDRECRTQEEQIINYMNEIIKTESPYMLVEDS